MLKIKEAKAKKISTSFGYLGNCVALWEKLAEEKDLICELGSD